MATDSIKRRRLLGAGCVLAVLPIAARSQTPKPILIGWLSTYTSDPNNRDLQRFKEALAALGRNDGVDVVVEARWAGTGVGNMDRLLSLAKELAAKKPAVIVTHLASATIAASSAAPGIPVVQAMGTSPVRRGLAASYAHPGGLVTGLTNLAVEMSEKHTELLVDAMTNIQRIGYLVDATGVSRAAGVESARRAANRFKVAPVFVEVGDAKGLEVAFAQFRQGNVQAVVLLPSAWFGGARARIAQLALQHKLPLVAGSSENAEAGALLAYGLDGAASFRRAAWYVDQILKGKPPGELPIEQPSKFNLVVNLKTAKALGITIPPLVMVRADWIIQ